MGSLGTHIYQTARSVARRVDGLRYWSTLHPRSPTRLLGLTYASERMGDGAGAQLFRSYGIYALSRLLGIPYIHTPLQWLNYQGIVAFQKNEADPELIKRYNDLFSIPSDMASPENVSTHVIDTVDLGALSRLKTQAVRSGEFQLARIVSPFRITDTYPDCYESLKRISPFPFQPSKSVRIAVHVRWGDLLFRESQRLLGIDYYLNVIRRLEGILDELKLDRQYELYTELPTKSQPQGLGGESVHDTKSNGLDSDAEARMIAQFDAVPNLVKYINTDPIEAIQRMATAHVVIMSHSAFSYLPSLLNVRGVVIYHRFWHMPLRDWVIASDGGRFSKRSLVRRLQAATID